MCIMNVIKTLHRMPHISKARPHVWTCEEERQCASLQDALVHSTSVSEDLLDVKPLETTGNVSTVMAAHGNSKNSDQMLVP